MKTQLTKEFVMKNLVEIFRDYPDFSDSNMRNAVSSLASTYKELKKEYVNIDDYINEIHADLITFDVVYDVKSKRNINQATSFYKEISNFSDRSLKLKSFLKKIEESEQLH